MRGDKLQLAILFPRTPHPDYFNLYMISSKYGLIFLTTESTESPVGRKKIRLLRPTGESVLSVSSVVKSFIMSPRAANLALVNNSYGAVYAQVPVKAVLSNDELLTVDESQKT